MSTPPLSPYASRPERSVAIYKAFLDYSRRRGFIRRVFSVHKLSPSSFRALSFLASNPSCCAKNIAEHFALHKVTLAREVKKFSRRRLIQRTPSSDDRRQVHLELSKAGGDLVENIDRELYRLTAETLTSLNSEEVDALVRFVASLAQRLGAEPVSNRKLEHPLNAELARLSTVGKIYSGQLFGDSHSLLEVQALSVLAQREVPAEQDTLARELGADPGAARLCFEHLQQQELIKRTRAFHDRRVLCFNISRLGSQVLERHRRLVGARFDAALKVFPEADQQRFLELLQRAGAGTHPDDQRVIQDRLEVRRIITAQERAYARGFFVAEAVRVGQHFALDQQLFAHDSENFGLFMNGTLRGTCEARVHRRAWNLVNVRVAIEIDGAETRSQFTAACHVALKSRSVLAVRPLVRA